MIVFDIETESWDKFRLGAIRYQLESMNEPVTEVYRDPVELFKRLLEFHGEKVWSWNGGRYDILWLLDLCVRFGIPAQVSLAGARVVRALVGHKGKQVEFLDAFAFCPLPLNKAAEMVGEKKKDADDYSWIREGMPESDWQRLDAYLRHDVDITFRTLEFLFDFCHANGIEIAATVGAAAWKTAAQECNVPPIEWPDRRVYEYCRNAYFGGRVQVFRDRADKIYRYDINSAYPWALSVTSLPTGERFGLNGKGAEQHYRAGDIGIYRVIVDVPYSHAPPLPMRLKTRLAYPYGVFQGTWTSIELKHAEDCGVKIVRFLDGMYWTDSCPVLKPFMERGWALRDAAGKETALGAWIKFVVNSPTGKLAQQPERENVVINPPIDDIVLCPGDAYCHDGEWHGSVACCKHRCTGSCGRWNLVSKLGSIWSFPTYRIPDCGYVHWAAFLTAATRVKLHKALLLAGENAVYCDTDAVYSTVELPLDVGKELGQWAFEGVGTNWLALAPKTYAYFDEKKGKDRAKAKGMPGITASDLRDWWVTEEGNRKPLRMDRGVQGFSESARGDSKSLFVRRDSQRVFRGRAGIIGDRHSYPDGSTKPPSSAEARAL